MIKKLFSDNISLGTAKKFEKISHVRCYNHYTKQATITYAEVFDWLMAKGHQIYVYGYNDGMDVGYYAKLLYPSMMEFKTEVKETWQEAACDAIEKSIEILKPTEEKAKVFRLV